MNTAKLRLSESETISLSKCSLSQTEEEGEGEFLISYIIFHEYSSFRTDFTPDHKGNGGGGSGGKTVHKHFEYEAFFHTNLISNMSEWINGYKIMYKLT